MKSSELRVNNYVFKDLSIDDLEEIIVKPYDLLSNDVLENLFPIKLTEEWLLKFGFLKQTGWDDMIYFDNKGVHIYLCNDTKKQWFEYEDYIEIKSVHQLQNLYFALTNEELKIN